MANTQFVIILVAFLFGTALASVIAYQLLRSKNEKSAANQERLLTEKEQNFDLVKAQMEQERSRAEEAYQRSRSEVDSLQKQLLETAQAHARLEGVAESFKALEDQLQRKSEEIASLGQQITLHSSEAAKYKAASEEAAKSKLDALAAKQDQMDRLLQEKELALATQLGEVRAAGERQILALQESAEGAIRAEQTHCQAQLAEKDRHITEQKLLLEQAEKKLTETFDSLSVKALTTIGEQFIKTAKATFEAVQVEAKGDLKLKTRAIEEMLKPIASTMDKLQAHQEEMEKRRVSAFDAIEKGLQLISHETDQLANALRKPITRGSWGEMNLKVILDNAGLSEGTHYDLQHSTEDEEGSRQRTDVIIHLPNGRDFIIDSKAPLEAFWDGMNASDEEAKNLKFAAHSRLVREHVKRLSAKSYWARYKTAPDLVVMFIPTEGAYQAALEADPALLTDAHASRVYLANPMTLINMIHVTAFVLKEEASRQNADEIQATAAELYDRLCKFVGKFADLGRSLRVTLGKFNDAAGSMEGRVLPQARRVNALGVGATSSLAAVQIIEVEPRSLISEEALNHRSDSDGTQLAS